MKDSQSMHQLVHHVADRAGVSGVHWSRPRPSTYTSGTPTKKNITCIIYARNLSGNIHNYSFLIQVSNEICVNPLTAKLFNWNVYPLEVVDRVSDPQLQVGENYSDLTKWRSTILKYC